jgi:hypothetical protein
MKQRAKLNQETTPEAAWGANADLVSLCSSIFNENCCKELQEIHKHEILAKICEYVGPCPSNFGKAEEILEGIKYDITNYVIHHEYSRSHMVSTDLLLWLDGKANPGDVKKLDSFIKKYLGQCSE